MSNHALGWSKDPGPPTAGNFPAFFHKQQIDKGCTRMGDKKLSIFIDESGDFGPFAPHSPYYIVSMALHDQALDIKENVAALDEHLGYLGFSHHAIHTEPLIRREEMYVHYDLKVRRQLFSALFNFTRKLNVHYLCVEVKKEKTTDVVSLTDRLTKELVAKLREVKDYLDSFDHVIVYYDNGQIELTKILVSIFNSMFSGVEFRKVKPVDYKLFQSADMICTLDLLALKLRDDKNKLSMSETVFFENQRSLRKNYIKPIETKNILISKNCNAAT